MGTWASVRSRASPTQSLRTGYATAKRGQAPAALSLCSGPLDRGSPTSQAVMRHDVFPHGAPLLTGVSTAGLPIRPGAHMASRRLQFDAFAELVAAWSLAVASPFLRVTASEQPFFLAHGIQGADLVLFTAALVFLPPIILWLSFQLACLGLGRQIGNALLRLVEGTLTALIGLPLLHGGPFSSLAAVALVAGALTLAAAVLLAKSAVARRVLQLSALAAPLIAVHFLALSPASQLLSRPSAESASPNPSTARPAHRSLSRTRPPVVLIVFDELPTYALEGRNGRIDHSRFPTFASLARTSTWFRFATSPASDTYLAVPTIVSGARPRPERAPVAAAYPANLFSLLAPHYRLTVSEPVTAMCQVEDCKHSPTSRASWSRLLIDSAVVAANVVAPPLVRKRLPRVDQSYGDFLEAGNGAPDKNEGGASRVAADSQLREVAAKERDALSNPVATSEQVMRSLQRVASKPPFIFLHVELPHLPWHYFPDLTPYRSSPLGLVGIIGDFWGADRALVDQQKQRFLFQVGATDLLLARIRERLKSIGIWDRALVIVTADHGVAFYPKYGRREPFRRTFAAIASVPLFVKKPFQRSGRVSTAAASTLDIAPTVLNAAGLSGASFVGTSLLRNEPSRRRLTITSQKGKRVRVSWGAFRWQRVQRAKEWGKWSEGGWEAVSTGIAPAPLRRAAAEAGGSSDRGDVSILSFTWRRVVSPSEPAGERRAAVARRGESTVAVVANVSVSGDATRARWVGLCAGRRLIAAAPVYEWLGGKYASLTAYGVRAPIAALRKPEFVVR